MAVVSRRTKGKFGLKAAGTAVKNPGATRLIAKSTAPAAKGVLRFRKGIAKRIARQQAERVAQTARTVGETLAVYGPQAAQLLGWVEPPKRKRTAPWLVVGVLIGASAMYLLEPGSAGEEHRAKVSSLVS